MFLINKLAFVSKPNVYQSFSLFTSERPFSSNRSTNIVRTDPPDIKVPVQSIRLSGLLPPNPPPNSATTAIFYGQPFRRSHGHKKPWPPNVHCPSPIFYLTDDDRRNYFTESSATVRCKILCVYHDPWVDGSRFERFGV